MIKLNIYNYIRYIDNVLLELTRHHIIYIYKVTQVICGIILKISLIEFNNYNEKSILSIRIV